MWQASGLYFTIQKKTPRQGASIVPLRSDGGVILVCVRGSFPATSGRYAATATCTYLSYHNASNANMLVPAFPPFARRIDAIVEREMLSGLVHFA